MATGRYPRTEQHKHNQSLGQYRYYATPEGDLRKQTMSGKMRAFYLNHPEARQKVGERAKGNTNRLGYHNSELMRERQSQALKGRKKPPLTDEHRGKLSKAHMGLKVGKNHPFYGKHHSLETRAKMKANRPSISGMKHPFWGKHHSESTKESISNKLLGRCLSQETKDKMSQSRLGDKNNQWLGGISFAPYSMEFKKPLKREVRERDNYICQLCKIPENGSKHDIHHIDYDKHNTTQVNLITLCRSCNLKANHNRRYWQKYFTVYQSERSLGYA